MNFSTTKNRETRNVKFLRDIIYEFYVLWRCDAGPFPHYRLSIAPMFTHEFQFPLPRNSRLRLVQRTLKKGRCTLKNSVDIFSLSLSLPSPLLFLLLHRIFPTKVLRLFCRLLMDETYFSLLCFAFIVKCFLGFVLKWKKEMKLRNSWGIIDGVSGNEKLMKIFAGFPGRI